MPSLSWVNPRDPIERAFCEYCGYACLWIVSPKYEGKKFCNDVCWSTFSQGNRLSPKEYIARRRTLQRNPERFPIPSMWVAPRSKIWDPGVLVQWFRRSHIDNVTGIRITDEGLIPLTQLDRESIRFSTGLQLLKGAQSGLLVKEHMVTLRGLALV